MISFAFAVHVAQAQEPFVTDADWTFRLDPYLWPAAIDGDLSAEGLTADVSLGMGDAIDKGNGALGVDFTARNGDFTILTQAIYTVLEDTSPDISGPIFERAHVKFTEFFLTEALGYSLANNENGFFDLIVGGRLALVDTDIDLRGGPEDVREYSSDDAWVDPLVGINTRFKLTDGVLFRAYGDIGGFDAASSLTWQALAGLDFILGKSAALSLAYRAISYDYESGDFLYDTQMHGPTIGFDIWF